MKEFISGDGSADAEEGNVWINKSGYDGDNTLLITEKNGSNYFVLYKVL